MNAPLSTVTLMSGDDYRESLRRLRPTVFVDGRRVESVADEPALQPGINALALTYDYALEAAIRAADDGGPAHQRPDA